MGILILVIYVILVLIRPMEWWEPVRGFNLLDTFAPLLFFAAVLGSKKEDLRRWWRLPEAKISIFLLLGFSLSWLPWSKAEVINTFQSFGKTILLYNIILLVARTRRNFRILLWTVLACIGWMAVHGLLQNYRGYGFAAQEPRLRGAENALQIIAFGIFNDPNDLCLIFVVALPLLYSEFRLSVNKFAQLLVLAGMPLVGIAAWLTNSRGGVVGVFGMLVAYIVMSTKGIKRWLAIFLGAMFISVLAPSRFAGRMEVDVSRTSFWGIGLDSFKSNPLMGVGLGKFADLTGGTVAHNSFIEVLTETGLLGYLPWLLLIFVTFVHLSRANNLMRLKNNKERFGLSAFISALAGYLTAGYFLSRGSNLVLYVLLAMASVKSACVSYENNIYPQVFEGRGNDFKRGLAFCLASIPFLWITIRIANSLAK